MKTKEGLTRRKFIKSGMASVVASGILVGDPNQPRAEASVPTHEAEVPDTLDLAERAALSINALTGAADPQHNYETYHGAHFVLRPANMTLRYSGVCLMKPVHALPGLRLMSGSRLRADYDAKMLEACLGEIEEDGLWWLKIEGRPWRAETYKQDQVYMCSQARLLIALLDCWNKYQPDSRWLTIAERMVDGLKRIANRKEDRAWYHLCLYRSGWSEKAREDVEPAWEGAIFANGHPLRALARWYAVSGDQKALDLAARVARYMLRPKWWETGEGPGQVAHAEHAHWRGHFHCHTMGMKGLLEYAVVANDARLQQFVAEFYEYGRQFGIGRIGFFPAVIGPVPEVQASAMEYGGAKAYPCEGCSVSDMIWLAVKLSDAGAGDYWDDVDQYVRNQLVEHQVLRRDLLEEIVAASSEHQIDPRLETEENVIERNIGSFLSMSDPTLAQGWWTMCCNANCALGGLYTAWEAIVRSTGDVAQVNLFLNRASPWMDVDSYLPYEGKVVLKNKTAGKAYVRIPRWVDKKAVRCHVNQQAVSPSWLNNYLSIEGLAKQDVVTIEFPLVETTEKYTEMSYAQEYTCRFKGNTLVDISPRAEKLNSPFGISDAGSKFPLRKGYPLYQRGFYSRTKAPLKKRPRWVSPTII